MTEGSDNKAVSYRFGRFELNVREGLLSADGQLVPLSPKVFDTLLLLVRNNGRMLSKDEIMAAVWADSFVEETNLTSNISRLRKTLHEDNQSYIETFPKRGYRFRAEVTEVGADTEIVVTRKITARMRQVVRSLDDGGYAPAYAAALATVPNNLELTPTALIGREAEVASVVQLLAQHRLVTLTGIGGTGKTRLAQEIGGVLLSEFADGVFFIGLAELTSPERVAPEIARALSVKAPADKDLMSSLTDFVTDKHLLLIVDNFEQILAAARVLAELLTAAAAVSMLVTSRAPLRLPGEREFVVPPLALPEQWPADAETESGLPFTMRQLGQNESVKLFAERAQVLKPAFSVGPENARSIVDICLKLEGLPLAIELAAARIKILSPAQIAARLDQRLKILTGGSKDRPARQQTMRGAIEWSYDLLAENERKLFQRLAVFAGGFTVDAAEAIAGDPPAVAGSIGEHHPLDVLNGLTELTASSLLLQTDLPNGEARFRFLEVVREYALERFEAGGEAEATRTAHAKYYLTLAEEAAPEIFAGQSGEWLGRLETEHDNLRAALAWGCSHDAETAGRIAAALRNFWVLHHHIAEGRRWLELAIDRCRDVASLELQFRLFNGLGHTAGYQGDLEAAWLAHENGLRVAQAADDLHQITRSMRGLGFVAKAQGDLPRSRQYYHEALDASRALNDRSGIAVTLTALGDMARMDDDWAAARTYYDEALAICEQTENKPGVLGSLNNLGAVAFDAGDLATAHAYYSRALTLTVELGESISLSYALDGFAALAVKRAAYDSAAMLAGKAEQLRASFGFETEPAERRFRDAYLAELRAGWDEAEGTANYQNGRALKLDEAVRLARGGVREKSTAVRETNER